MFLFPFSRYNPLNYMTKNVVYQSSQYFLRKALNTKADFGSLQNVPGEYPKQKMQTKTCVLQVLKQTRRPE